MYRDMLVEHAHATLLAGMFHCGGSEHCVQRIANAISLMIGTAAAALVVIPPELVPTTASRMGVMTFALLETGDRAIFMSTTDLCAAICTHMAATS
jgi:hypothetical protein